MILAILVVLFAVFIILGIPMAFILGLVPAAYFLLSSGSIPSIIIPQKIIGGCPSFTLMQVEAPTPTAAPKAAERFIRGNVIPRPAIASGPTT